MVSLMIRIEFTVEDIARVSFLPEPAPMLELKLALISLRRRDPAPRLRRWQRAALAGFPASARPLWDLVGGFSGALSTTATCGDFDEALDTAQRLTPDQASHEARLWSNDDERGVPRWLRAAAEGDRDAKQGLIRALSSGYDSVLRPYWPGGSTRVAAAMARIRSKASPIADCLEQLVQGPQRDVVRGRDGGG